MVADKVGVVKVVPVPKLFPPVSASYQVIVPVVVVAFKTTVPLPHLDAGVTVTTGLELIVATTAVFVGVVQPLLIAFT